MTFRPKAQPRSAPSSYVGEIAITNPAEEPWRLTPLGMKRNTEAVMTITVRGPQGELRRLADHLGPVLGIEIMTGLPPMPEPSPGFKMEAYAEIAALLRGEELRPVDQMSAVAQQVAALKTKAGT